MIDIPEIDIPEDVYEGFPADEQAGIVVNYLRRNADLSVTDLARLLTIMTGGPPLTEDDILTVEEGGVISNRVHDALVLLFDLSRNAQSAFELQVRAAIQDMEDQTLAQLLTHFKDENELDNSAIGRAVRVSGQTVANWLNGTLEPSFPPDRLAKAFGVNEEGWERELIERKLSSPDKLWTDDAELTIAKERAQKFCAKAAALFKGYSFMTDVQARGIDISLVEVIHPADIAPEEIKRKSTYISEVRNGRKVPTDGDIERLASARAIRDFPLSPKQIAHLKDLAEQASGARNQADTRRRKLDRTAFQRTSTAIGAAKGDNTRRRPPSKPHAGSPSRGRVRFILGTKERDPFAR